MKNQDVIKNLAEEKYLGHALRTERMKKFILNNWYFILKMPVCSHCETLAFWHKDGNEAVAYCPKCGTTTRNPIAMGAFLEQGHHVDKTIHEDAKPILDGEKVDAVVEVNAGDAGLSGDPNRVIKVGLKE